MRATVMYIEAEGEEGIRKGLTLFDLARQSRRTDPETSRANADGSRAGRAMAEVLSVMRDGVPRIDEEIAAAARDAGCTLTDGRLRHGRLAAVEAGLIKPTGEKRRTSSGAFSREWVFVSGERT